MLTAARQHPPHTQVRASARGLPPKAGFEPKDRGFLQRAAVAGTGTGRPEVPSSCGTALSLTRVCIEAPLQGHADPDVPGPPAAPGGRPAQQPAPCPAGEPPAAAPPPAHRGGLGPSHPLTGTPVTHTCWAVPEHHEPSPANPDLPGLCHPLEGSPPSPRLGCAVFAGVWGRAEHQPRQPRGLRGGSGRLAQLRRCAGAAQRRGLQDGVLTVSQDIALAKGVELEVTEYYTYLHPDPSTLPEPQLDPDVQLGTLSPAHVELLNSTWPYGGNVWSRRYLGELLRRFPHLCLQDPAGNLLGWMLTNGFAAGTHGYIVPTQRRRGLMRALTIMAARQAHGRGFPVYGHTATDNRAMQRLLEELGHRRLPGLCYFVLYNPALARAAPGAPPGSNA
ncbi:uncharacterized protein LOC107049269 isoform X4 [Gallus gallus]|uniref:uncharacterized protein LOC107049269 isoform X4 n=1 Tax=Gallus gallus TaxID=9031 RepID=UPI001AE17658|nr:uncharacterized protein LOC107049269 isoform X4 [Gallus gallus]